MTIVQGQQLLEENGLLRQENRLLRQKIDYFIKKYFGGNKSEKSDPEQLELLIAGLAAAAVVESPDEKPAETPKARTREQKSEVPPI